MRTLGIALVLLLAVAPGLARAECRASPSGAYSYDTRLSPRAGIQCLLIVDVYEGASCGGTPAWSVERSCGQTHRLALTDHGRLISILAPRASRREWNIVLVTTRDRPDVWIHLGDLPGVEALHGTVRLELDLDVDRGAVRMRDRRGEARASFEAIEAIADRELARPRPPPRTGG